MSASVASIQSETREENREQAQSVRVQKNMAEVRQALSGIVETSEIDRWLSAPNRLLGGNRPIDSIKQGKTNQVMEILAAVQEGIHV